MSHASIRIRLETIIKRQTGGVLISAALGLLGILFLLVLPLLVGCWRHSRTASALWFLVEVMASIAIGYEGVCIGVFGCSNWFQSLRIEGLGFSIRLFIGAVLITCSIGILMHAISGWFNRTHVETVSQKVTQETGRKIRTGKESRVQGWDQSTWAP